MKNTILIIGLLVTAMLISSCREIKVDTIVNKDGSFIRVITVTGDSSDLYKPGLPYPVDLSWETNLEKDTTDDKHYILTYTKKFNNSNELNYEISADSSWKKQLKRSIEINKSFGFFYSYITYNELICAANPFTELDYKDYLTSEDMLWLTGKKLALNSADSTKIKDVEDKAEDFIQKSFTAGILSLLRNGIEEMGNPEISTSLVDNYKDSIQNKVTEWDYDSVDQFVDYFARITDKAELKKIKKIEYKRLSEIDKEVKLLFKIFEMEDYTVTVELPGLLTSTNSSSVVGNKAHWNVSYLSFLFDDYNMVVESRVVNMWMFVVAGIVVMLLLTILMVSLWRR